MDKLSAIFAIADHDKRKAELNNFARSLNVNIAKAKNASGEVDENKLAILLFEALQEGSQKRTQRKLMIILAVVFFILSTIGMYFMIKVMSSVTNRRIMSTEQGEEILADEAQSLTDGVMEE